VRTWHPQFHFGSVADPHCAEQPKMGDCTVPGFGPEYCQQRHIEDATLHTAFAMAPAHEFALWAHWERLFVKAAQASVACA
jgi:hypothetical protein